MNPILARTLAASLLVPLWAAAAPDDDALHPGYALETVLDAATAPEITGMAFLPGGAFAFSHWGGNRDRVASLGKVVLFTPVANDPARKWAGRDLATGLMDPVGLAFDGRNLYVGATNRIARVGLDGAVSTLATVVTSGNNHEYNYSMVHKDGRLYATLGQAFPPAPSRDRGMVLEVDPAAGKAEFIAGGLREANGLGVGPEGELFATDNQGHWVPASKLVHIARGRDYGFDNPLAPFNELAPTQPALWLPHGELIFSPGQPLHLTAGPFAGQLLIGELCQGGIRRAYLEKVKGVWQGAAMRFVRKGIATGPLRLHQSADGAIWFGGLRGIPGFNCDAIPGGARNGLHRLVPTGKPNFEVLAVRSREGGFEIEFTRPAAAAALLDKASFELDHFRYLATAEYGGPKLDGARLTVSALRPGTGNRSVSLDVAGLKEGFVVHFRFRNVKSDSGQALWQEDAWYTLNRLGRAEAPVALRNPAGPAARHIFLTPGGLRTRLPEPHRIRVMDARGRLVLDAALAGPGSLVLPAAAGGAGILHLAVTAEGRTEGFRLVAAGR